MHTPQAGIFALGTSSHAYLEFDKLEAKQGNEFASTLIFRRNMPYGRTGDHGTMFVGCSADQNRLSRMLDSMAGLVTGTRDALTRFTQPLTGAYYFVPSVESLRRLR
jgi:deferrochelatase/peroxidase EfeB